MKLPILTDEEAEVAVREWADEDPTRAVRLSRGHWEDIVPVISKAQLAKLRNSPELKTMKRVRESLKAIQDFYQTKTGEIVIPVDIWQALLGEAKRGA